MRLIKQSRRVVKGATSCGSPAAIGKCKVVQSSAFGAPKCVVMAV